MSESKSKIRSFFEALNMLALKPLEWVVVDLASFMPLIIVAFLTMFLSVATAAIVSSRLNDDSGVITYEITCQKMLGGYLILSKKPSTAGHQATYILGPTKTKDAECREMQ